MAAALVAGALLLLAVGTGSLRNASVDTLPEFLPPQVQVQTEALGLSTAEVEQLITVPLEDEFNGIAFLDHLRSQSVPGLSSIELTFKPGTDVYQARQLVTERVAQGPAVVNVGTPPVMIQPKSDEGRTMMVALSSATTSPIDVSTLARWRIRPRLLAVPGVANVTIWGQRDQQLQVLVDPARLHAAGISLDQVLNTTGDAMWTSPLTYVEASSPGADGFIDTPNQRLSVQQILPISTPQDLAKVPVEDTGVGPGTGKRVALGQVTTVVEDHPAMRGDAVLAGGTGLLLVVEKLPGANTLAVDRGVRAAMAELKPGLSGITVDTSVFRPASFVQSALGNLGLAGAIGLALLTLWFGLSRRSWRGALVGLVSVALPLVAAAYVLYLTGATFTGMTLLGLLAALGVIVDDAVTGVVALRTPAARRAVTADGGDPGGGLGGDPGSDPGGGGAGEGGSGEGGSDGGSAGAAVSVAELFTEALVQARRPLGYALGVLLLAVVPPLLLPGLGGALSRPVIVAYLYAVLAATVVALTVAPALARLLLRPGASESGTESGAVGARVERGYLRLATGLFRPAVAVVLAVVLAGAGLTLLPQLRPHGLMPATQDRDLLVQWQAAPGTSLPAMEQTATAAGDALRALPGVRDVASNVGQALMGDQVVNVDSAETWITVAPNADYARTTAGIRTVLARFPTVRHTLLTYPQLALQQGAAADSDGQDAIRVRLYGTDPATLTEQAGRLRQAVAGLPGVTDPVIRETPTEPSVRITTDVDRAAKYGLKPGDVRRATAVLVAGIPVGSYYQQQQIFDVTVWSTPTVRSSPEALGNLLLDTPSGGQVALKDIATVAIEPAPVEIDHDQASRYLDLTASVHGQDLSALLPRVRAAVSGVALPLGYHAEVSSGLAQTQDTDLHLLLYVLAALLGALLLFQAALRSWSRALLLLLALPFALAGGAVTALLDGSRITAGGLVGFLPLLAVAVRGGLGVLRRCQDEPDRGAVPTAVARFAPAVLGTAVGLALLLVPFTVRGDLPGLELARPLALVVLGGLVSSTLVTLFLLPALHLLLPGGQVGDQDHPDAPDAPGSSAPPDPAADVSGAPAVATPGEVG